MNAVYYPGLESHPHYKVAKSQMKHFSGMISFEIVGEKEDAVKLVEVSVMWKFYIPTLCLFVSINLSKL